jgi:hypothetical protein
MESENFDRSLRDFVRHRPFESFQIRFVDGESITIDHPEAVVFRGGVAGYISPRGEPTLFDHRSVSTLGNVPDAASA